MRHTAVLSDIHLCEIEPERGLWMRYRQAEHIPDHELAAMLAELSRQAGGDELTLVFNGDIFDFDAPRVVDGESRFHDLPRSADHTEPVLRAILDDHPVFVRAVGEALARGRRVVFLSGNHDMQLTLPALRATLTDRLVDAARKAGAVGDVAQQIAFRGWLHRTEDNIVIEHGSQYDDYCAQRYPTTPVTADDAPIHPTVGSLTSRHLTARMGFFNPHVESSFMLSTVGYVGHWLRHYMLSKRSLVLPWLVGSVKTMMVLVRNRQEVDASRKQADLAQASLETGVPVDLLARHADLFATPADDNLSRVLRELWLDRVLWVAAGAGVTAVWLALPGGSAAGAALATAMFANYERTVPKPPLDDTWQHVHRMARSVGKLHNASAVVFGHTHHPEHAWEDGVFHGNSGSWSPAYHDIACTRPIEETRPLVWLGADGSGVHGGLVRWSKGGFSGSPRSAAQLTPSQTPSP